jgi:hypothetical protein
MTPIPSPQQSRANWAVRVDRLGAAMAAESRTWLICCPVCGTVRSVWDAGGLHYKALGSPWQWRQCPHCGHLSWQRIYRATSPPAPVSAGPPDGAGAASEALRRLAWMLGTVAVLLLLFLAVFLATVWLTSG